MDHTLDRNALGDSVSGGAGVGSVIKRLWQLLGVIWRQFDEGWDRFGAIVA